MTLQRIHPRAEAGHDADQVDQQSRDFTFKGPFFTSREAAAYVCSKSVRAFYAWARRHGVIRRGNGSVAKVDLDRALRVRRRAHRMAPASLANLRKRA